MTDIPTSSNYNDFSFVSCIAIIKKSLNVPISKTLDITNFYVNKKDGTFMIMYVLHFSLPNMSQILT
jgi:hypothetical protein